MDRQADPHEITGERLGQMFTVRREQPRPGSTVHDQQRFQEFTGYREDLVEVHDAMLEFETGKRRLIKDAQVPRITIFNIVAVGPPRFGCRVLRALPDER